MKKIKGLRNAFTVLEIVLVAALSGMLISIGFTAFMFMRDGSIVSNDAQGVKSAIRETQDKALTLSVYSDSADQTIDKHWVYGYSLEYNSTNKEYNSFAIISNTTDIPTDSTNTESIRNIFRAPTNQNCLLKGNIISTFATCHLEKTYVDTTSINFSNCNMLFTSVNGKITIQNENNTGSAFSCRIYFKLNINELTLTLSNSAGADIKICNGKQTSC